jgi:hypothetical protein
MYRPYKLGRKEYQDSYALILVQYENRMCMHDSVIYSSVIIYLAIL